MVSVNFKRTLSLLLATSALATVPSYSLAAVQQEVASHIDDVVVTARLRSESAQDVPSSLVVLSSQDLENKSIRNISDLANATPGLSLSMTGTPASSSIV